MLLRQKRKRKKLSLFSLIPSPDFSVSHETKQSVWIILLLFLSAFIIFCGFGKAGQSGAFVNSSLRFLFGYGSTVLPVLLALASISLATSDDRRFDGSNIFGLFLFLMSFCSLMYFFDIDNGGGLVGAFIAPLSLPYVGDWVGAMIFSSLLFVSLLLILDASISDLVGADSFFIKIVFFVLAILSIPFAVPGRDNDTDEERHEEDDHKKKVTVKEYDVEEDPEETASFAEEQEDKETGHDDKRYKSKDKEDDEGEENPDSFLLWPKNNIKMNFPVSLLKGRPNRPTSGNIDRNQAIIKKTLKDFGVPVSMGEVRVGPSVTQYTFKPDKGIPVARVKVLADDLALNLALHPVRIEAPIPGKPLVGLEVPNQTKVLVTLKEVIQSKVFKSRKKNTMIALGRDVSGDIWMDDLATMPHLLVAGATGSGKSVCLHSLIVSLLYQNDPDDLKIIMIDPKQVEFVQYNGLPYLIAPVVTDNKRAIRALQWCITEMERRLEVLTKAGCQNVIEYNKGKKRKHRIPKLVVMVDELGDLLTTARKEAESAIIRLGQKARAAGIHLILATQRPTVDILSGLIKANIPGRIAFSTTSSMNSKTILEFCGAENLLGQGDMLFINSKLSKPVRIQGTYVSKEEIKAIVKYAIQKAGKTDYVEDVTEKGQIQIELDTDEIDDDLLEEAKHLIMETGKASASSLQSRLSIGYPRANRILDILEKKGVVGPSVQNKPREILSC